MVKKNESGRILSCIQPTGEMHLGNYFGAVKNWVERQNDYECFYGVVDLHAQTMPYNPRELKENTLDMVTSLLACGIDPEKSVLFIQSLIPQHTELAWIFNCLTPYGDLSRMTQFKEKSAQLEKGVKNAFISAGLFTYPVLQAADILIYRAGKVPVGKDQEQHLELSRTVAARFNNQFGDYFPQPQPLFTDVPKLMSIADPTKKMSKSLSSKHYVGLFEKENSIRKKLRAAPTDSGHLSDENQMSAGVENLFNLLKAANDGGHVYESLMKDFYSGVLQYKHLKEATADALVALTGKFIQRKNELLLDKFNLEKQVQEMSAQARAVAAQTIRNVRELVGLPQMLR